MLVKDIHYSQKARKNWLWFSLKAGLGLLISGFIFINFIYPFYLTKHSTYNPDIIHCDAENVWKNKFISNGNYFGNANKQTSEMAFTGKHSCKLVAAPTNQYGFGYEFTNPENNTAYEVSVWRFRENKADQSSYLNVYTEKPDHSIAIAQNIPVSTHENGWELLRDTFYSNKISGQSKINIYVHSNGVSNVYFDDLVIKKVGTISGEKVSNPALNEKTYEAFNSKALQLIVKDKNLQKLKANRKKALEDGMLVTNQDSWVKGKLREGDKIIPVKLRLKGDWLDHLKGNKWSFRIKAKDPYAWNRMITFSLQSPQTRFYTMEWLMHELWGQEDVISPRYDFVQLYLNETFLGWYAYEEHFDKQVVEFKDRREGPIVRFSEESLWDHRLIQQKSYGSINNNTKPPGADLTGSEINVFKASKVIRSGSLNNQFEIAKTLLHQYQFGLKKPAEVFDIDLMAKYVALADLAGSYHSMIWHNQRFYYNPVIGKLEPIGYDAFTGGAPHSFPWQLSSVLFKWESKYDTRAMLYLVEDIEFQQLYLKYLFKFCQEDYLNDFFKKNYAGWQERSDKLREEFPEFKYDIKEKLLKKAKNMRKQLLPFDKHSVKAYWARNKTGSKVLSACNTHYLPLKITGFSSNDKILTAVATEEIYLKRLNKGEQPSYQIIDAPESAKFVFYELPGLDSSFVSPISPFSLPRTTTPFQEITSGLKLESNSVFAVNEKEIKFTKGKYTTTKDIIIPAGFRVYFEAGVELNLLQKAKFVSYSPVLMDGTETDPIIIHSGDKSGNGFNVLQAKDQSLLSHVIFDNLKNLDFKGWQLTGAVTFYESDVKIDHCFFRSNHCEDILNIVRSEFTIDHSKFSDTFGDAFDGDFSKGTLKNSIFFRTGNDAADFSGSKIRIENCKMNLIGDKGISVGEQSEVIANNLTMDGGIIGVASKDLSILIINNISIKDFKQAFTAYQKKPEFGPSKIEVNGYKTENCERLYSIAPNSELILDGKLVDVLQ